jgi:glyoxylase I family protein
MSSATTSPTKVHAPVMRLHHNAYVTKDMEKTRHFYEDLMLMPLVATWCETDFLFGADRTYCHCFFGLKDGSALAFFQFAKPEDQAQFDPQMPFTPFNHIALKVDQATQDEVKRRLIAAEYKEPQMFVLEHGYCTSLYATDPNGMIVELTVDASGMEASDAERLTNAHSELKRWLAGDHRSNNTYRPDHH